MSGCDGGDENASAPCALIDLTSSNFSFLSVECICYLGVQFHDC